MSLSDFAIDIMEDQDWKEATKEEISYLKSSLETEKYDERSIAETKAQIETYELSLKYDINYIYSYSDYWKIDALNEMQEAKCNIFLKDNMEENQKIVNNRISIIEKDDYSGYLELIKQEQKSALDNKLISEEEYNEQIYLLNLREKYEIYKEPSEEVLNWKESTYQDIATIKQTLRAGINTYTGKMLKLDEIEQLEDRLKINEYRLENGIPTLDSTSSERALYDATAPQFCMIIVALLMVIIAGSGIGAEISKGTIKFLLFTPNKRWKVLLSKIISATIILLVLTIVLALLSVVIGNIFFEESGSEYVYISNGEVKSISNLLYMILYFLASSVDILVYMIFAFMLSTITRNTALSVGVSIACYVGSGIIMNLINYYISADWVKYIPFNNMGIADKIFENNISYTTMQMASGATQNAPVVFSLSVLTVCIILMIISMFDSFNKRDIV